MTKAISIIGQDTTKFLSNHELAVLSTIDGDGELSGAVVYYTLKEDFIYILTKRATQKAHNMQLHPKVALTVFDEAKLQTAQLQGVAEVEEDYRIQEAVFDQLIKLRRYESAYQLPPVTKVHEGAYVFFRITPTQFTFSDFSEG